MRLIIIGGGAAGMTAAITAARYAKSGTELILLEGNSKPGKKLLSTGNGHCNLTNTKLGIAGYHSDQPALVNQVLSSFGVQSTMDFFTELGIPMTVKDSYVYPKCREASAVREALASECLRLGVQLICDSKVDGVSVIEGSFVPGAPDKKAAPHFSVHCMNGECYEADRVLLAAGGMAFPKSGSDGSGFELAMDLGHGLIQPLPGLVALTAEESFCKNLAGVRFDGSVQLYINGIRRRTESGEIQLTDYGVSGIPVFQLSGDAVDALMGRKEVKLQLNFWEGKSETDVLYELKQRIRQRPELETGELLRGIVPDKTVATFMKLSGIELHVPVQQVNPSALAKLCRQLTALTFTVNGAKDFDSAQVTRGGVPLSEVDGRFQSRLVPGLFFAGEILNVDGICGGYNLQWAWASGCISGRAAVQ